MQYDPPDYQLVIDAEFLFVPTDQAMEVAERAGATPYDVKGVELGHHSKTNGDFDS